VIYRIAIFFAAISQAFFRDPVFEHEIILPSCFSKIMTGEFTSVLCRNSFASGKTLLTALICASFGMSLFFIWFVRFLKFVFHFDAWVDIESAAILLESLFLDSKLPFDFLA
jgi:hypothetical protein